MYLLSEMAHIPIRTKTCLNFYHHKIKKIFLIHSESIVFLEFHVNFQLQFKVNTTAKIKICKICSKVGLTTLENVLLTLF